MVILLSQAVAQHRDTSFTLKSFSKNITARLISKDSLIISELSKQNDLHADSIFLETPDSTKLLIDFLGRWGVNDTTKEFKGFIKYLDSLKHAASSYPIIQYQVPFRVPPTKIQTDQSSVWESPFVLILIGIVVGFISFVLVREAMIRKKRKSNNKSVYVNGQAVEPPDSDAPPESAPKQEQTSQIILHADILVELKKRKIEMPKKGTINDVAKKLLASLSELEKKQVADLEALAVLKAEKGEFENEKLNLTTQIAQVKGQVKQLTDEKNDLTEKIRLFKELAVQDEQLVFKALEWINRADDDIHNQISRGDGQGANQQLVSSALNGLLLFQSYLEYRRKLTRSSGKDAAPATQKSVEMDANLRILMGERVELKQPGPGVSDAPPLTGQLREVAKQQGLTEITPFGYSGYKIKL
ncbi:MAG: hypothetical protein ACKO44_05645 [Algoriphagus sp.]